MALRARASKDSSKHLKKVEEFIKAASESASRGAEEVRTKVREIIVKQNVLKDEDWTANSYIEAITKTK